MDTSYYSNQDVDGIVSTIKMYLQKGAVGPARNTAESLQRVIHRSDTEGRIDFEDTAYALEAMCTVFDEINNYVKPDLEHDINKLANENILLQAEVSRLRRENTDYLYDIVGLKQDYKFWKNCFHNCIKEVNELKDSNKKLDHALNAANQKLYNLEF